MELTQSMHHLRRRGFHMRNIWQYPARGIHYLVMDALKSPQLIRIGFGANWFRMIIRPLGQMQGSRGIFLFREDYEPLLKFGAPFLKKGDVAIDLGANQGIYTCAFAAAVGPSGRVVAVEPLPHQVRRIKANLAVNEFGHVRVSEAAISDTEGTARLNLNHGDTAASIMWGDEAHSIEVKTTTLDDLVETFGLERVDFIKIDVEGAEHLALNGAKKTLKTFRPMICFEKGDGQQEAVDILQSMGYEFFELTGDGDLAPVENTQDFYECLVARHAGT